LFDGNPASAALQPPGWIAEAVSDVRLAEFGLELSSLQPMTLMAALADIEAALKLA
jgi:hypothetical protein